jgi:hypothetical protein
MTLKCSIASALALAALSYACSSEAPQVVPPGPQPVETGVSSLLPNTPADGMPADGMPAEDMSADRALAGGEEGGGGASVCPEVMLFGSLVPGCCRGTQGCGGQLQIGERSWLCVSPGDDRSAEALRDALTAHAGEPLVAEPSCPGQTLLDGATLPGCCIVGGTCGVSTEPWTVAAAELGLQLPSACITTSEAAEIAGTAVSDAGPPPACDDGSMTP